MIAIAGRSRVGRAASGRCRADIRCRSSRIVGTNGIGVDVIHAIGVDVIEVSVLPCTGIDVEPYVHCITFMDIELLYAVCTENTEQACSWVLIFGLNDEFLRFPRVVGGF